MASIDILNIPSDLQNISQTLFTNEFEIFLSNICREFDHKIEEIFASRVQTRSKIYMRELQQPSETIQSLAEFINSEIVSKSDENDLIDWNIGQLPVRLENRRIDLGDVSPSDTDRLEKCLNQSPDLVQGIQVDFDDGHCPSWRNQLKGWHNVFRFVRTKDLIVNSPILMLRPRAWNMTEQYVMVDGKKVNGALLDFAMLIFHNGQMLTEAGGSYEDRCGPFFYLSKLESPKEAKLWNEIFTWTEATLGLLHGTIKACILIENILAAFDMESMLFEIREHAIGLNCGIWDYSASIINKFGKRSNFIIPDRKKYVNMDQEFLKSYMNKVIETCHKHGAKATGGMAAQLLSGAESDQETIAVVCKGKQKEINAGVDGFLIYDFLMINPMNKLWKENECSGNPAQLSNEHVMSLLNIPTGSATFAGLLHNVQVGIRFIYAWLVKRQGSFEFKGCVEDSATAEISRSQVWQWIRHQVKLEDGDKATISRKMVQNMVDDIVLENPDLKRSSELFMEIVLARDFPEFITTYLSELLEFKAYDS